MNNVDKENSGKSADVERTIERGKKNLQKALESGAGRLLLGLEEFEDEGTDKEEGAKEGATGPLL